MKKVMEKAVAMVLFILSLVMWLVAICLMFRE
jgi:hypothetical protein